MKTSLLQLIPSRVYSSKAYFLYGRYRFLKSRGIGHKSALSMRVRPDRANSNEICPANPILFVIPSCNVENWKPAEGNLMYEIVQSAIEKYGQASVICFFCEEGNFTWKEDLLKCIRMYKPGTLFIHVEIDPNGSEDWTIDVLFTDLRKFWDGQVKLFLYDSVYFLHLWRVDAITKFDSNCEVISIDISCKKFYRGKAPNLGPCHIPISAKSLRILQKNIGMHSPKDNSISFVGATYPYRTKQLMKLQKKGLEIEINLHRNKLGNSSYKSFIEAVNASRFTLNFSRAHNMDRAQLKCRILEAGIFGTIIVSDERKLISQFLDEGKDFLYSPNFKNLPKLLSRYSDEDFSKMSESLLKKCAELNKSIV